MQRKIRLIKSKQKNASEVYGITIPPDISVFFKNTYFTISKSGTSIILVSGTEFKEVFNQIGSLSLENYRI